MPFFMLYKTFLIWGYEVKCTNKVQIHNPSYVEIFKTLIVVFNLINMLINMIKT